MMTQLMTTIVCIAEQWQTAKITVSILIATKVGFLHKARLSCSVLTFNISQHQSKPTLKTQHSDVRHNKTWISYIQAMCKAKCKTQP